MAVILLVDDDVDLVEQNRLVLEARGLEVQVAYSGSEARAALDAACPDAAVLDVMMESPTAGLELARWVHEKYPELPMIMLSGVHEATGSPFRFEPDEAWLPVLKFLDKPVAPGRLADEVASLTGERSPITDEDDE
ncbi:MAG: response regulator [Planctomycetota bacterium]